MVQFADLWRNHPINESVITPCIAPTDLKNLEGEAIRKNYPVFPHQCAVRMGVCLHRSGVTVEQLPGLATCNVVFRALYTTESNTLNTSTRSCSSRSPPNTRMLRAIARSTV